MMAACIVTGKRRAVFCDSTARDNPRRVLTSIPKRVFFSLCDGYFAFGTRSREYLMSLGIANSLPEAVQIATTGLANWLEREYKLEPNEAAIVLGTSMQYNIAELVDPLVHVVAKVRKDALAGLK